MARSIVRNKRALSPVIATVILVSVTIVVAVSVAYWMGTIAGGYTAFEQIELPTAYATLIGNITDFGGEPGWNVTVELKNTGSADATINQVFLNAKPLKDYTPPNRINLFVLGESGEEPLAAVDISIDKGTSKTIVLQIQKSAAGQPPAVEGCTSGTRIDLKIHTAAGRDYPVQVKLP